MHGNLFFFFFFFSTLCSPALAVSHSVVVRNKVVSNQLILQLNFFFNKPCTRGKTGTGQVRTG